MRPVLVCLLIGSLLLWTLAGCKNKTRATVTLVGSTSVQPLASEWAAEYMEAHPDVKVLVQPGGSTAGIKAAMDGTADIGTSSRELTREEAAQLRETVIARDGLAVVVNTANPVGALTTEQIQGLFSGRITNWKDVGGKDAKVHLVTRDPASGTHAAFLEMIMHRGGSKASISPDAMVHQSNGAVRELVHNDPDAIGYMSLGLVGHEVKAVEIDGAKPTLEAAIAGQYKLVRPFLFVTKGKPQGDANAFIEYVLSPPGQKLLSKEGLLPPK